MGEIDYFPDLPNSHLSLAFLCFQIQYVALKSQMNAIVLYLFDILRKDIQNVHAILHFAFTWVTIKSYISC